MNKLEAKQCFYWYEENFNNAESFDECDEILKIKRLLQEIADGQKVLCVPYTDNLMNEVFPHNENPHISHTTRTHYEDIGFNRALKVMVATGRMAKVQEGFDNMCFGGF